MIGFSWRSDVFQDWDANEGAAKSKLIMVAFRQTQRWLSGRRRMWHPVASAAYTVAVNWILGVELPPETQVGPGLCLMHPQAIVINRDATIGARCMIRASTTLGNKVDADGGDLGSPVVGDDVEFGVGAIVIGWEPGPSRLSPQLTPACRSAHAARVEPGPANQLAGAGGGSWRGTAR
jgi:putative colanic acid biosynthesis acetyltransferase WcaB